MSQQNESPPPSLIYFGDPMCSWCYGFGPVLHQISLAYPDIPLVCVMGGLRPGPHAEKLDQRLRRFLRQEWGQIAEVTGRPFGYAILEKENFLYNTEPASRALVVCRRARPDKLLDFLDALQTAFYRDGRDITEPDTLSDIYASTGCGHAKEFLTAWAGAAAIQETQGDFQFAQSVGMTAFPSLVYAREGKGQLLCRGYLPFAEISSRIDQVRNSVRESAN
jgi:putative protein-disulfide isomerase